MQNVSLFRHVRLGIKSLMLHKLRSFLTMLGVVFGVGSVVAMLSVGEGASQEAMRQISKLGSHNIILESVKPQAEQAASQNRQQSRLVEYGLLYEDLERIVTSFPAVERAVPAKVVRAKAKLGSQEAEVRLVGTTPGWFELVQRDLVTGRVLTELDVEQHAGVCVLTESVARGLLATRHTVGQIITVGSDAYTVVGIIHNDASPGGGAGGSGGSGVQTPDRSNDVYIPISVARQRLGDMDVQRSSGSFSAEKVQLRQIILQIGDTPGADAIENVEPTAEAITTMLRHFHKQPDYTLSVPLALLRQARETQRIFNIVLGSIAGISLLVGGIGIMNIMLASVTERTREIGVRRAIGAKRRQIIGQFLIETVVLSVAGGLIGVGLGVVIPELIERFAQMPTVVTLSSVLLSLGISAAVGIIFGLYPAFRAAMLDPIIALRHE